MKQKLNELKSIIERIKSAAISDRTLKSTMFAIGALTSDAMHVIKEIEAENIIKCSEGFTEHEVDENDHYNQLLDELEKYNQKPKDSPTQDEVIKWGENFELKKNDPYTVSKHDEKPESVESEDLSDEGIRQSTKQYLIEKYGELSFNSFVGFYLEDKPSNEFGVKSSDLYELYKIESQAKKPMHTIEFSEKLIDRGFEKKKIRGCIHWNVKLK